MYYVLCAVYFLSLSHSLFSLFHLSCERRNLRYRKKRNEKKNLFHSFKCEEKFRLQKIPFSSFFLFIDSSNREEKNFSNGNSGKITEMLQVILPLPFLISTSQSYRFSFQFHSFFLTRFYAIFKKQK
jgi:hypothetical protein